MGVGMAQRSQPGLAPERRLPPGDGPRRDTVKIHSTQGAAGEPVPFGLP